MFHRYLQSTESSQQPLRDALKFYGSIFCVGFVVYCYVRKRFPRTYAVRQWVPEIRTPAADDQFGYISWLWKVYSFSADELQEIIGLDALCFLRLLNMGFRLACIGAFNSIWLLPVYGTAEKSPDAPAHDAVVNDVSFNDLQDGSPRFIATVIAAYVFFGYTMYTIQKECTWLITQRQTWMRKLKQRNYSVLVRNIPSELRSDAHLLGHFQRLFGADRVLEAHVVVRISGLEALVQKRNSCISALEHALAQFAIEGTRPKKLLVLQAMGVTNRAKLNETELDAIEYYTSELNNLNDLICEKIDAFERQADRTVEVARIGQVTAVGSGPQPSNERSSRDSAADTMAKLDASRSSAVLDDVNLSSTWLSSSKQESSVAVTELVSSASSTTPGVGTDSKGNSYLSSAFSGHFETDGVTMATLTVNDAATMSNEANVWNSNRGAVKHDRHASSLATNGTNTSLAGEEKTVLGGAGFVTFCSTVATQGALQMKHRPEPYAMRISQAPDPLDIFWGNVDKRTDVLRIGRLLSVAITIVICFFWTFVVTFIVNMANVEQVSVTVTFVGDTVESNRWLETLLPLLSPLILQIFNSGLLPVILKAVSRLEFPASDSLLEASAFWKMAAFTIIQTFFVSLITGSIVQELADILESPADFIALLANTLPQQSVFFMQLLIVSTCLGSLNELFRVVPIFYSIVRAHIGWRLTEKELKQKVGMFRALSNVDKCYFSRLHSAYLLYFIVMFVYSTISPLVNWFCLIFFCFVSSIYRHQLIFNYPNSPDSGGKIFLPFLNCLLACMIIAQLTIAGFLVLKKSAIAAPLMAPLLIGTILYIIHLKESLFSAATFLAASTCVDEDDINQVRRVDFSEFKNQYKNPVLMSRSAPVDWDAGKRSLTSCAHSLAVDDGNGAGEGQTGASNLDDASGSGEASKHNGSLGRRALLARFWSLR